MSKNFLSFFNGLEEISLRYDAEHRAIWCYYDPAPRPVFSTRMLTEIRKMQQGIMDYFKNKSPDEEPLIRYNILLSKVPGIFSMGGDLALFYELIKNKDRQKLSEYATQCIDTLYLNSVNFHLPVTTISLVEGQALGGGFECALSSNVLIATENSEMGFPEIKFNLFPGMGAYQFISRSCGAAVADKMLATGDTYSAKELYDMGIVNHICKEGKGVASVEKFMKEHDQRGDVLRALQKVRRRHHPIEYAELDKIADLWVETALTLEEKDLRLIDRIVKAQLAKMAKYIEIDKIRTKQDRRFPDNRITFPLFDDTGEIVRADRRSKPDRRSPQN